MQARPIHDLPRPQKGCRAFERLVIWLVETSGLLSDKDVDAASLQSMPAGTLQKVRRDAETYAMAAGRHLPNHNAGEASSRSTEPRREWRTFRAPCYPAGQSSGPLRVQDVHAVSLQSAPAGTLQKDSGDAAIYARAAGLYLQKHNAGDATSQSTEPMQKL